MQNKIKAVKNITAKKKKSPFSKILKNYEFYILILPAFLYFLIFMYMPMYGVQIAFKDYIAVDGIMGSPWIGFDNFKRFFSSYQFWTLLKNTISISVYQLVFGFPLPIILALMINELRNKKVQKFVQTITYAPHFLSVVVLVGMMSTFLLPSTGLVNIVIKACGGEPIDFMSRPEWFKPLYVMSGIWQNTGWNAIIYIATLVGIDVSQHEAATVDGATKFQRIWHIDLPGIMPTAIILLIMEVGKVMSVGFEKVFLMQTPLNLSSSEIISTYVYKMGLLNADYSFATAIGLFNSVINLILLVTVNQISKRVSETSLW